MINPPPHHLHMHLLAPTYIYTQQTQVIMLIVHVPNVFCRTFTFTVFEVSFEFQLLKTSRRRRKRKEKRKKKRKKKFVYTQVMYFFLLTTSQSAKTCTSQEKACLFIIISLS